MVEDRLQAANLKRMDLLRTKTWDTLLFRFIQCVEIVCSSVKKLKKLPYLVAKRFRIFGGMVLEFPFVEYGDCSICECI